MPNHSDAHKENGAYFPGRPPAEGHATERCRGRGQSERRSLLDRAIELALAEAVLFTCQRTGQPFAEVKEEDHIETHPIEPGSFTEWLLDRCYEVYDTGPSDTTLKSACAILRGLAHESGTKLPVFLRFGYWEGAVYWDLGDDKWRCIRITADGWTVVPHADTPIRFRRSEEKRDDMMALPDPEPGGTLDEFRELLNVPDDQWPLVRASILCNFLPKGTVPILFLSGPTGSGKTCAAGLLRWLVDPCDAPITDFIGLGGLLRCAYHNAIIVVDHISGLSRFVADRLSRLASGHGIRYPRYLRSYKSFARNVFNERRSIIITSIYDVVSTHADLRKKCFTVRLPRIRRFMCDDELEERFGEMHGRLVGAIADLVSAGLREWERIEVRLTGDLGRYYYKLLDAIHWAVAAEKGMNERPLFLDALAASLRDNNTRSKR